jgi:hypothetical protein
VGQLGLGLDVEAADTDLQRAPDLVGALAHTREDDPGRIAAGGQHPLQLADRDDVETRTQSREHVQDREIGVGLDREADQMRMIAKGAFEGAPVAFDRRARIDIAGRAETFGDLGERHILGVEESVAVVEVIHAACRGI